MLSGILLDPTAITRVSTFLRADMFYSGQHRLLYATCLDLAEAGQVIDPLTVDAMLRTKKRLAQAGGAGFLAEILEASPAIANVVAHAEAVHSAWRARELIAAARRILVDGYGGYGDVQAFAERAVASVEKIARESLGQKPESNLVVLKRVLRGYLETAAGTRVKGIPYGLPKLDAMTSGMHSGQKITICAMTGRGKTVMGLQACVRAAKRGIGSLFFTTEMQREELLLRLVSMELGIETSRFRDQLAMPHEWQDMFLQLDTVAKLPIEIIEAKDMRIDQIADTCHRYADSMVKTHGAPLGVIAHDYVQRMPPPKGMENARKYDVVSANTKGLKKMAQSLKLPVIELAQMKALQVDKMTGIRDKPTTGAAADSQEIEKEADVMIYLYRKPLMVNGKGRGEDPSAIVCALDKQRGGPPGELDLILEGKYQRFVEADDEPAYVPSRGYGGGNSWHGADE